jgi:hypothetical protein
MMRCLEDEIEGLESLRGSRDEEGVLKIGELVENWVDPILCRDSSGVRWEITNHD